MSEVFPLTCPDLSRPPVWEAGPADHAPDGTWSQMAKGGKKNRKLVICEKENKLCCEML